ncbi:MAG: signal peptidase II [Planctomycetota bacterium]|nr:MAG: signal peptidase II [Planctomycetota bacterium]
MNTGSRAETGSGSHWRRLGLCLAFVALIVSVDLYSKAAIFEWLGPIENTLPSGCHGGHHRYLLVGNWFALMLNVNYGAAFGQLDGIPYVLVCGRVLAVILLTWLVFRAPFGHRLYLTSLVLILGGALGNLYDNLFQPIQARPGAPFGPVRDFIDVYFEFRRWHFPTFNVGDSCITVGAVLLLLSGFGGRPEAEGDEDSARESGARVDGEGRVPPPAGEEPGRVAPTRTLD